jgi:hypothetical protein
MPSPDFVSLVESPNGKKKLFLPEQIHYHIANQKLRTFQPQLRDHRCRENVRGTVSGYRLLQRLSTTFVKLLRAALAIIPSGAAI